MPDTKKHAAPESLSRILTVGKTFADHMDAGDGNKRRQLKRVVIDVYYEDLLRVAQRIRAQDSRLRRLGEADELVNGFFEKRLVDRDDYLRKWRRSKVPRLRHWMRRDLEDFYAREAVRPNALEKKMQPLASQSSGPEPKRQESPEHDRDFAKAIITLACESVAADSELHGQVLYGQYWEGKKHTVLAEETGHPYEYLRTHIAPEARKMFKAALRALVEADGAGNVDEEIDRIWESFR